jgi:activator of HSP90 ATPase
MIENLSNSYDDIEILQDNVFIKKIHDRIDSHIEDIKNQLINNIAIQTKKKNKLELRDILLKEIPEVLDSFSSEFKQSLAVLSHLSDVENKTNLLTAILYYEKIENQISNELYKVLSILNNQISAI